jgi:hypothetical protein
VPSGWSLDGQARAARRNIVQLKAMPVMPMASSNA